MTCMHDGGELGASRYILVTLPSVVVSTSDPLHRWKNKINAHPEAGANSRQTDGRNESAPDRGRVPRCCRDEPGRRAGF